MKNIETFDGFVGDLLNDLLEKFPVQIRMLDLSKVYPDTNDDTVEVLEHAMDFLIQSGVIVGHRVGNAPWYGNVGLTMQTLALLRQVPVSLQQKVTWVERMQGAGTSVAKESLAVVTREFLNYMGTQVGLKRSDAEQQ